MIKREFSLVKEKTKEANIITAVNFHNIIYYFWDSNTY